MSVRSDPTAKHCRFARWEFRTQASQHSGALLRGCLMGLCPSAKHKFDKEDR